MVDVKNEDSGWTVSHARLGELKHAGMSSKLDNVVPAPPPFDIREAYADQWFDNTLGSSKGQFTFAGLGTDKRYVLTIWGARDRWSDGMIEFTTGEVDGPTVQRLRFAKLLQVTVSPDPTGAIAFTLDGVKWCSGVNIVAIQELEEPSSNEGATP